MRRTAISLALLLAASPLAAQAAPPVPTTVKQLALGHQLYAWFEAGLMDSIVNRMAPDVRERSGGVAGLTRARAELAERAGTEAKLLEEKMTVRKGLAQYWRAAMYSGMPQEPIVLRWLFDEKSQVVGFGLGPMSSTPEPDKP